VRVVYCVDVPRAGLALVFALTFAGSPASAQRNQQLWYQAYEAGIRDIAEGRSTPQSRT
jgi:hypothetical protein